jgi:hypothetical protein
MTPAPFKAYVVSSLEKWNGLTTSRTAGNPKLKVIFASAADEAKWKSLGSPELVVGPVKPFVNDYDFGGRGAQIGNHELNAHSVATLPTGPDGVEALLRKLYTTDRLARTESFTEYLWTAAQTLLAGSITPGTQAALYRVLAKQPGITARPAVDWLGRRGIGLTRQWTIPAPPATKGDPGLRPHTRTRLASTLIIDPGTARLLAWEDRTFGSDGSLPAKPDMATTIQSMGWTDRLGAPASSS